MVVVAVHLAPNELGAQETNQLHTKIRSHLDKIYPPMGGRRISKWAGPIIFFEAGLDEDNARFLDDVMEQISELARLKIERQHLSMGPKGANVLFAFDADPSSILFTGYGRAFFNQEFESEKEFADWVGVITDLKAYQENALLGVAGTQRNYVNETSMVIADHTRLPPNQVRGLILAAVLEVFANGSYSNEIVPSLLNTDRSSWGGSLWLEKFYPVDLALLRALYGDKISVGMQLEKAKSIMAAEITKHLEKDH